SLGFGLYVDSTSDIVVGTGNLSVGAFTLDSEEAIEVTDATINSGANDITLTASSSSEGIFGVDVFGPANADVTLTNAHLIGGDITVSAISTVNLEQGGLGPAAVKIAVAVATSEADVVINDGT